LSPGVSNDGLSVNDNEGSLILPCEIYFSAEKKLTFFLMRSGASHGKSRLFGEELASFIKTNGFSNVILLSATLSPVKRERESNR